MSLFRAGILLGCVFDCVLLRVYRLVCEDIKIEKGITQRHELRREYSCIFTCLFTLVQYHNLCICYTLSLTRLSSFHFVLDLRGDLMELPTQLMPLDNPFLDADIFTDKAVGVCLQVALSNAANAGHGLVFYLLKPFRPHEHEPKRPDTGEADTHEVHCPDEDPWRVSQCPPLKSDIHVVVEALHDCITVILAHLRLNSCSLVAKLHEPLIDTLVVMILVVKSTAIYIPLGVRGPQLGRR